MKTLNKLQERIGELVDKDCRHHPAEKCSCYEAFSLEDVLIAVDKGSKFPLVLHKDGMMGHIEPMYKSCFKDDCVSWILGKPLSEQSEETIDFLWEILK